MFKSILSVLGGAAVGVFTISLIEYLSHELYPVPAQLGVNSTEAASTTLGSAPTATLLLILFAYAIGSFFGGMVAARYAPSKPRLHALVVGVLLLIAGIANLLSIPHPVWFAVASVLVYLPLAYFGGYVSSKRMP